MVNQQPNLIENDKKKRTRLTLNPRLFLYILIGIVALISIGLITVAVYTSRSNILILASAFTISTIIGLLAVTKYWPAPESIKLLVFSLVLEISIALTSAIFPVYSGFPYAILAIAIAFSITSIFTTSVNTDWVIWTGLLGVIGSILLSILAPFPQIIDPNVQYVVFGFAGILLVGLIILFATRAIILSLRVKLILGALALSLIPITALALINNQYLSTSIQQQANDSLQVAANQTISAVDSFIQQNLDSIANEASLTSVIDYLSLDPLLRKGSSEEKQVLVAFRSLQSKQKVYLPSYAILNFIGTNLLDTNSSNNGSSERSTSYFRQSANTGTTYASSVEFIPGSREAYINFITPVVDQSKQVIGYLRVRYDARILQTMLESYVGLIGDRSYPILIDSNGLRLADGSAPNLIYRTISQLPTNSYEELLQANRLPSYIPQSLLHSSQEDIANIAFSTRTSDFFTTSTSVGKSKISQLGVIERVQTEPWQVVFLQDQSTLNQSIANQNRLSAIISTLIAALVAIFITVVANSFSRPILELTKAAEKISGGEFGVQAPVTSRDEIGILSKSFNSMTSQLKDFIDTLENRVQERTHQLAQQYETLQFRSRQLQTVSDVARGVVSSREIESLLATVTTLISERFKFYHVGIFLNDSANEYTVLRAANSAGGRKMLARQHKLQVGQVGIVGFVTGEGKPRIATDVGQDAVFFNNPDLPETKSEMALPLKVGDNTIGALDVQSIESNAFSNEDIELFSTLADQVAIAINNNQLFEETTRALSESERVHRQYLNQEWTRQSTEGNVSSIRYTNDTVEVFSEELPEVKMVLETARPVFKSQKDAVDEDRYNSTLTVPILLYGESIGVIHLQESAEKPFTWSQNDLLTVQEVANQVSQSLENARLFEDTIRRADRERKVLEITSKIRSTNDPQKMLQITLEELKRNLGASKAQIVFNVGGLQDEITNQESVPDAEKDPIPQVTKIPEV
jgi:GAF domain-containing protein/HAMP domain-containing protein